MAEVTVKSYKGVRGPNFGIYEGKATATSAAIAATLTARTGRSRLASITLKLNIAGTTTENFTVTKTSVTSAAAEYDVLLFLEDLEVGAVTDLVLEFDDIWLVEGDAIVVAWPNSENRTYGLVITLEEHK